MTALATNPETNKDSYLVNVVKEQKNITTDYNIAPKGRKLRTAVKVNQEYELILHNMKMHGQLLQIRDKIPYFFNEVSINLPYILYQTKCRMVQME